MLLMVKQSFQSIGEEGSVWQHDETKSLEKDLSQAPSFSPTLPHCGPNFQPAF